LSTAADFELRRHKKLFDFFDRGIMFQLFKIEAL